ncbi:hypothetical protein [Trueperella bialowiezensis]|uniref:Uncharacterized protein n=1 Tax=Trueperella bialowiezensis TaxID=312285 RepID=A0A3S4VAM1_9ACTO|nr:hypothetical protein [Trueperella bialowiezensis]VEI13320.1 Uncharacterised protein [Trueperella bialowiezensis]
MISSIQAKHSARILSAIVSLLLALAGVIVVGAASPAHAAGQVVVSGIGGQPVVSASGVTDIRVSGRGFQSLQGGFGGIYVLFGWVDDPQGGSWKPSRGGQTGVNYAYVPDTEEKDNLGYMRFVTFPGSSTASAANGGEIAADGSWSLTMRTPGARFVTRNRDGSERTIDCTQVQCGIITIGAHGVANSSNETFTPVTFQGQAGDAVNVNVDNSAAQANRQAAGDRTVGGQRVANPQQAAIDEAARQAQGNQQPGENDGEVTALPGSGFLTLALQQKAIQAGAVLGFTGQGFQPGEQVVVTLGDGSTGAGPLIAGTRGEVAGAIPIPADARPGTQVLRVTSASTGQTVEEQFRVYAPIAAADGEDAEDGWSWGLRVVILIAALIVAFIVASLIMSGVRQRRQKKQIAALEGAGLSQSTPRDSEEPATQTRRMRRVSMKDGETQ